MLDEDPELCEALSSERLRLARARTQAAVIEQDRGEWDAERWPTAVQSGLGLLVLDGLLLRRVGFEGRFGSELLAEGDLLRPWQPEDGFTSVRKGSGWRVIQGCRLAVLDLEFARRIAPYPEVYGQLFARAVRRCRNFTITMAILQRARVEERLYLLLWSFASRWGKVRADGVFVQVTLTHAMLGELLAARRQTVTAALTVLERNDKIARLEGGVLLKGLPPAELQELAGNMRQPTRARSA